MDDDTTKRGVTPPWLKSVPSLKSEPDELLKANKAIDQLLMNFPPDIRERADAAYIASMTQWLSYQLPDVVVYLTHPVDGIHTTLRFLPSIAEMSDFVRKRRETTASSDNFFERCAVREAVDEKTYSPGLAARLAEIRMEGRAAKAKGPLAHTAWWEGRRAKLAIARGTYPKAFLHEDGTLMKRGDGR